MITEIVFKSIHEEVKAALYGAFDLAKNHCQSDYVLLLADGEYKGKYLNYTPKMNPYVIDDKEDTWVDETRVNFFVEFLKTFYSFPSNIDMVDNSEIRLNMELMIYSHVWESKPFLKKLSRLVKIATGSEYDWKINVPPKRYNFIKAQIKTILENKCLLIESVINNAYHSSLRNAFAHSEYSFDSKGSLIWLHNYGSEAWEMKNISFDDWSKRLSYSILLAYNLINITHERRKSLPDDFKTTTFKILHPNSKGQKNIVNIIYEKDNDRFHFS